MRRPLTALAATLAAQACASIALTAPSVLAPAVAPMLGFAPERIGLFVGFAYLAAMFSGLVGASYVPRFGAIRITQAAMLACAAGLAVASAGRAEALVLAAMAIGVGYGLTNPSAAQLLGTHAPPERRGLMFSIKQTGVPIGVASAGLLVPPLLILFGWQSAVWVLAGIALLTALALVPTRALFDAGAGNAAAAVAPALPLAARMRALIVAPLALVLGDRGLRRLGVTSFCYALTQLCFLTFVVAYLTIEHRYSLAAAAGVLAAAQVTSVVARIAWGHVADRWIAPATLLGLLGIGMAASAAGLGVLPASAPPALVLLAATACAATSVAWNGVYFADLARRAPAGALAIATGGTQFMTFSGAMCGPVLFGATVSVTGSYSLAYVVWAIAPLGVGVWLLATGRGRTI